MGPVCHCAAINHAVGWDSQLAVEAEKLLARLRNRADLVAALDMRLLDCPTAGPAEVTR
jgi:hypothetical protein